jgi:hypothetical protein
VSKHGSWSGKIFRSFLSSSLPPPLIIQQQKRLDGRTTLKEYLIPVFLLAFWIYITLQNNSPITYADPVYSLRNLPPLSGKGQWGIFQDDDDGVDVSMFVYTKLLLYSPNTHQGVNDLMDQLAIAYPQIDIQGQKSSGALSTEYEANLFTTWGALEFQLTDEQITTGKLITSTSLGSDVSYKLRISPSVMVSNLLPSLSPLPLPCSLSSSLSVSPPLSLSLLLLSPSLCLSLPPLSPLPSPPSLSA